MQISRGIIHGAQKITVYGPEGIGKSYFASKFPNPVFIDTEGSTKHMDVARVPKPSSWTMLLEQVKYFKANPYVCDTLIIDTADWAEKLCREHVLSTAKKDSISDFGHGQGYVKLMEEFGRLLNVLTDLIDLGINVVIVAHATMRKFEQPDETGSFDSWEMKLEKKVFPLIKEWSDMILFANYKTYVVNVDNQGAAKGKNKVQGGKRVMYTTHHPCWDAKNRHDLLEELPFDFDEIRHCIPVRDGKPVPVVTPPTRQDPQPNREPISDGVGNTGYDAPQAFEQMVSQPPTTPPPEPKLNVPKPLADLMQANNVTVQEIQQAVASKGYYPIDTPIDKYDPGFIDGVLVGAWGQVWKMISDARFNEEIPY
ncbi:MAG: ATP-binding protein [Syntrophomonadaceae bacterium]|nr:ATP-binding protein [Syntrophomonadaceae bacterium]